MSDPLPKPPHLSRAYASQFQDASVASAYRHRPPYSEELFPTLLRLIGPRPRRVLDLGTGNGAIARGLCEFVDGIDAVDFSRPMLELARTLPKGDAPNIRWIHAAAEEVPLDPPYGLVTAGSSLHWMDWHIVLPRMKSALPDGGYLAIFDDCAEPRPWDAELNQLIPRYSTNKEFRPIRLIDELTAQGLFTLVGRVRAGSMAFAQSINEHVESMHARNGFSRDRMTPQAAAEFDRRFKSLLARHCPDGVVRMHVFTEIAYGFPMG
jgi:SAM-dependent methyltransferase